VRHTLQRDITVWVKRTDVLGASYAKLADAVDASDVDDVRTRVPAHRVTL